MTTNADKNHDKARTNKINKIVTIATIVFIAGVIIHLYFAVGSWAFITSFFSTNPIPWIMLGFVMIIVYFAWSTYIYFRKHL